MSHLKLLDCVRDEVCHEYTWEKMLKREEEEMKCEKREDD